MADEKATPPTTVRFTEGELKIIEEARREDENLSQFIRTIVMNASMAIVSKNAAR